MICLISFFSLSPLDITLVTFLDQSLKWSKCTCNLQSLYLSTTCHSPDGVFKSFSVVSCALRNATCPLRCSSLSWSLVKAVHFVVRFILAKLHSVSCLFKLNHAFVAYYLSLPCIYLTYLLCTHKHIHEHSMHTLEHFVFF